MSIASYPSTLPWWSPEAMALREATIEAEVRGFVMSPHPSLGLPACSWFMVTKAAPTDSAQAAVDKAIANAAGVVLSWHGATVDHDPVDLPMVDFWEGVVGFGDDDDEPEDDWSEDDE